AGLTPERVRGSGTPDPAVLRRGGLAIGVPGEVAGLITLHRRLGRLPLAQVLAPAIRLAREGFVLGDAPHLAREIAHNVDLLAADPGLAAIFLTPERTAPGPGFRIMQPDLAATLETVVQGGVPTFH